LSKCTTSTSVSSLIAPRLKVDYDDSASTEEARQTKRGEIFQQIIARVSALPGVEAAGISDYLPLGPNREWDTPVPEGKIFVPGRPRFSFLCQRPYGRFAASPLWIFKSLRSAAILLVSRQSLHWISIRAIPAACRKFRCVEPKLANAESGIV
jgi:hypothetical protein